MNTVVSKKRKQLIDKLKLNIDKLNYTQINEIIKGIIQGLDVNCYLDPSMSSKEMAKCRRRLLSKNEVKDINKNDLCKNNELSVLEILKSVFKNDFIMYEFLSYKVLKHISDLILDRYNVSWISLVAPSFISKNDQEIIDIIDNICEVFHHNNIGINDDISELLDKINILRYDKNQLYEIVDGYKHGLDILLYADDILESFRMYYIKMALYHNYDINYFYNKNLNEKKCDILYNKMKLYNNILSKKCTCDNIIFKYDKMNDIVFELLLDYIILDNDNKFDIDEIKYLTDDCILAIMFTLGYTSNESKIYAGSIGFNSPAIINAYMRGYLEYAFVNNLINNIPTTNSIFDFGINNYIRYRKPI